MHSYHYGVTEIPENRTRLSRGHGHGREEPEYFPETGNKTGFFQVWLRHEGGACAYDIPATTKIVIHFAVNNARRNRVRIDSRAC